MFGLRRLSLPLPVLTNECLTGSLPMLLGLPVDKRKCFHIQTSALTLECHRILTTSVTWRWLQKFNYMRWKKTWRWSILDFSLLETIVPYCEFLELPPTQRFMQNSVRFVCNIFRGKFFLFTSLGCQHSLFLQQNICHFRCNVSVKTDVIIVFFGWILKAIELSIYTWDTERTDFLIYYLEKSMCLIIYVQLTEAT